MAYVGIGPILGHTDSEFRAIQAVRLFGEIFLELFQAIVFRSFE
jgi:hypothetical protein